MPTFNQWFSTSLHGSGVINVKSPPYNAVGDGSTDDTLALQAAFDTAWGTRTEPHGNDGYRNNRPVYMPPGDYKITAPLYITGVAGGRLFGDSGGNTTISIVNPMAGSLWRPPGSIPGSPWMELVSPCLSMNGLAFFTLDGISLRQLSPIGVPANANSVGIDFFNWAHTGGGIATNPVYRNLSISNFQSGIVAGFDPVGGNSENGTLYNVVFNDCTYSGLVCFHQNVLNWNVFGGGCNNCSEESTSIPGTIGNNAAGYSAVGGNISVVSGVKMINNGSDFYNGGGSPWSILGGYSNSHFCMAASSNTFMAGFSYRPEVSQGSCLVTGSCHVSACVFDPVVDNGPGHFGHTGTNANLEFDGLKIGPGGASSSFSGSGSGSSLYVRGVKPQPGQDLFATYTGRVLEYIPEGATLYSYMPAHAKFTGLSRVISDATSATPGTDLTSGTGTPGTHVYAYCTGTAWRVLGPAVA